MIPMCQHSLHTEGKLSSQIPKRTKNWLTMVNVDQALTTLSIQITPKFSNSVQDLTQALETKTIWDQPKLMDQAQVTTNYQDQWRWNQGQLTVYTTIRGLLSVLQDVISSIYPKILQLQINIDQYIWVKPPMLTPYVRSTPVIWTKYRLKSKHFFQDPHRIIIKKNWDMKCISLNLC